MVVRIWPQSANIINDLIYCNCVQHFSAGVKWDWSGGDRITAEKLEISVHFQYFLAVKYAF